MWLHWFFFLFKVSTSSEPLLSSFIAFLAANYIYTCDALHGACILLITVRTHDACIYHRACISSFTIHTCNTHTYGYVPYFAIHCSCTHNPRTYHCLLPVWACSGLFNHQYTLLKVNSKKDTYVASSSLHVKI